MPFISISMYKGRTNEQKERLIKNVTEAVVNSIECSKDAVWIKIEDVEKENWGMGGVPSSKKK
jgi:4-oxalocrotonate tautomerase